MAFGPWTRRLLVAGVALLSPSAAIAAPDCMLGHSIGLFVAHSFTGIDGSLRQGSNYGPVYNPLSGRLRPAVGSVVEIGATSGREALERTKDQADLLAFFELVARARDVVLPGGQRTSWQNIELQANLRIIDAVGRKQLGAASDMVTAAGLSVEDALGTALPGLIERLTNATLAQACGRPELLPVVGDGNGQEPPEPEKPWTETLVEPIENLVRDFWRGFPRNESYRVAIGEPGMKVDIPSRSFERLNFLMRRELTRHKPAEHEIVLDDADVSVRPAYWTEGDWLYLSFEAVKTDDQTLVGEARDVRVRRPASSSGSGSSLTAQPLDSDALKQIMEVATQICGDYFRGGSREELQFKGEAELKLDGLMGWLADAGVSGAGDFSSSEYVGVLQEQLGGELKDARSCKLKIWNDLKGTVPPAG